MLVQAAPVLLGVPLYLAVFHYAGMLVFFFPGVFMVIAGLVAALVTMLVAPSGFVRAEAAGSLRFHGVLTIVSLAVLALVYAAVFAGGIMAAASGGAMLLGVLLPLVEIGRALMYGISAARRGAEVTHAERAE